MVQFLCPSVQFRFPFFVELRGVAFQTFHDLFRKRTGCQCSNVSFTHLIGCGNMEREHTDAHIELKNETKKKGEHSRTTKQPQNQTTKQPNNQQIGHQKKKNNIQNCKHSKWQNQPHVNTTNRNHHHHQPPT